MLNLGCGQYLRNPFFPGFWGQKWGCGFCIIADYTRLYTVIFQKGFEKNQKTTKKGMRNFQQAELNLYQQVLFSDNLYKQFGLRSGSTKSWA